jgi:heme/copper-type cytochrome/quinol oxidase subunit 2
MKNGKGKGQAQRYTTEITSLARSGRQFRFVPWVSLLLLVAMIVPSLCTLAQEPRVIQMTADKDNMFKIPGQKAKQLIITVKAGEVIKFKITAHARESEFMEKDGAIHSFTISELKDQGWDVRLKEGMNEFVLVAPSKPGEYEVACTIKCGKGHDDMKMKMIVTQ